MMAKVDCRRYFLLPRLSEYGQKSSRAGFPPVSVPSPGLMNFFPKVELQVVKTHV